MIGRVMCRVFGHQPHKYTYDERHKTTEFHECARCNARKNLTGRGWSHE